MTTTKRSMPVGAEIVPGVGTHFRVWAPKARQVALHTGVSDINLAPERDGYFSTFSSDTAAGVRYGFRLDGAATVHADPASRSQPDGPHGLSETVDPVGFVWTDRNWKGVRLRGQVLYEMHVGSFTPQGTWRAAMDRLPQLAEIGISLIEMMPVACFAGRFGWGYDGVCWFAPSALYGDPDDLRAFVDRAHALGLGVILDVVYNHFGPEGNYLPHFSDSYTTDKYPNEWGQALNFDGPHSAPVREYVRENAAYWIREFHFDGLRLDATQQIFDDSSENIVAELARHARDAAQDRQIVIIAENEPQDSNLVRAVASGGFGLDAIWNDDFHHSTHVALTGHNEAYYSDYTGSSRELVAAVKYGFLYQGQRSAWQSKRRGKASLDIAAHRRVTFLENHDQIANSGAGQRLIKLTDAGRLRAATALLLLAPGTPMLFQGQEWCSAKPFLFFADLNDNLTGLVAKGRREFLSQFPSLESVELALPHDEATFDRSKLDWSERDENPQWLRLHRDLIALKKSDAVLQNEGAHGLDIATLTDEAFLIRHRSPDGDDRLLTINFGTDLSPRIFPDPLLAPPDGRSWQAIWSSENPAYGGGGIRASEDSGGAWHIPGQAAVLLAAKREVTSEDRK